MTKKEISYTDLVKHTMDKARAEAKKLGKEFDNRAAFGCLLYTSDAADEV